MVAGVGVKECTGQENGFAEEAFREFPVRWFSQDELHVADVTFGEGNVVRSLLVMQMGFASVRIIAVSGRSPRLIDS